MTRIAGAHRERFLPYRYVRKGIELAVRACVLDGKADVATDLEGHIVDLDLPWRQARLTLEVIVPFATYASVAGDAPLDAFELVVITHCPRTFLRRAQTVPLTVLEEPLSVELTFAHDELAGSAELGAFLVRVAQTANTARGARVSDSRSWELRVDRHKEPRGDYLDVRYEKFSDSERIPRIERGNLYRLELEQDEPVLWINADHERIAGILDSRGAVGRHARLRDSFFDHIAYAVWMQLFLKAARDYAPEGEVTYPWQDSVLDLLLKDLFPAIRSSSERRARLRDLSTDTAMLMSKLDSVLQRRNDLAAHLTKLVHEGDDA